LCRQKKEEATIVENVLTFRGRGDLFMKKSAWILGAFIACSSASLSAADAPMSNGTNQPVDCSQLTPEEQDFASQMMDMKNRAAFCSKFTPEQRTRCMQLMGQPDSNGTPMNADQACMQVMKNGSMPAPATPQKSTGMKGGCPVQ
jgi:hypothetical protein